MSERSAQRPAGAVKLGSESKSLKELAPRILGQEYPCAAVALMLFDPSQAMQRPWEIQLNGVPTTATVMRVAQQQAPALIVATMHEVWEPYDSTRPLLVTLRITTESHAENGALSSIACSLVHSNGTPISSLSEAPVRFRWTPGGSELLGIYAGSAPVQAHKE